MQITITEQHIRDFVSLYEKEYKREQELSSALGNFLSPSTYVFAELGAENMLKVFKLFVWENTDLIDYLEYYLFETSVMKDKKGAVFFGENQEEKIEVIYGEVDTLIALLKRADIL